MTTMLRTALRIGALVTLLWAISLNVLQCQGTQPAPPTPKEDYAGNTRPMPPNAQKQRSGRGRKAKTRDARRTPKKALDKSKWKTPSDKMTRDEDSSEDDIQACKGTVVMIDGVPHPGTHVCKTSQLEAIDFLNQQRGDIETSEKHASGPRKEEVGVLGSQEAPETEGGRSRHKRGVTVNDQEEDVSEPGSQEAPKTEGGRPGHPKTERRRPGHRKPDGGRPGHPKPEGGRPEHPKTEGSRPRHKRGVLIKDQERFWTDGIIPYVLTEELPESELVSIAFSMDFVSSRTCLRFVPWDTNTMAEYGLANDGRLNFIDDSSCYSYVGNTYDYNPDGQSISCCYMTACVHELGHAAGLEHEQKYPDIRGYLRTNWFNIPSGSVFNYAEEQLGTVTLTGYDMSSPMHYGASGSGWYLTTMFHEMSLYTVYFYFLRDISQAYQCQERHCSGLNIPCYDEGFVTLVNGRCDCLCPDGRDPDTGCFTHRTVVEKQTFPGGSYAFLSPPEGCPVGHDFRPESVTHSYTDVYVHSLLGSSVNGNQVVNNFCVREGVPQNAARWPRGAYCLFRVGPDCPEEFHATNITMETLSGGNSASGSAPESVITDNTVTFFYCCRDDALDDIPVAMPNTQHFTLLREDESSCQEIAGMGVAQKYYALYDPMISGSFAAPGAFAEPRIYRYSSGQTNFHFCYYYPLAEHPFTPPSCNEASDCPDLVAAAGDCHNDTSLAGTCPYSCDSCTGPYTKTGSCVDVANDCDGRQCGNYNTQQLADCRLTCRQCDEFCGGVITLTREDRSRVITSPNYPASYDDKASCFWHFEAPADSTMTVKFSYFDLEGQMPDGCYDVLRINYVRSGHHGLEFCGSGFPETIRSVGNIVEMTFKTDWDIPWGGFNATVSLVLPEDHCYDQTTFGRNYRGPVNYTRDFRPCLPWNQVKQCRHHTYAPGDHRDGLDGNFCRNPGGEGLRPWCYFDTDGCQRNYCDICLLETPYDTIDNCDQGSCANETEARANCALTCQDQLPVPDTPVYTSIQCQSPPLPADALETSVPGGPFSLGHTVNFTCATDHNVAKGTTCLTDGSWTPLGYVCGGCPDGWTYFRRNCYLESEVAMTHDNAVAHCATMQAGISEPRDMETIEFLITFKDDGQIMWMGLTLNAAGNAYVWQDGTTPKWTNWWYKAVDDIEDCTILWASDSFWDTTECTSSYMFVCSRPALAPPVCADLLPNCADLLTADSNACVDNPDFASHSCPLTCSDQGDCADPCTSVSCQNGGTCHVSNGTPHCVCSHGFDGDLCETAPDCQDRVPICQTYVEDGDCSNGYMHLALYACPFSCNWCDGGASQCQDIDPNCPSLVASTNCATEQTLLNCSMSCGKCDGLGCFDDQETNCRAKEEQGLCETDYAETVRLCPHTCDLCANPLCFDSHNRCDWWGSIGECESNPSYMIYNCPYTCDTCLVINACYSAPCLNGGTCTDDQTGYTCQCTAQYEGDNCEIDTSNFCMSPPALPADALETSVPGGPFNFGQTVNFTCSTTSSIIKGTTCLNDGTWTPLGYVCGGCPDGWTYFRRHCYLESEVAMTYDNAVAHCASMQAGISEPRDDATIDFLIALRDDGQIMWMGLELTAAGNAYVWQDGTTPKWTNWWYYSIYDIEDCTRLWASDRFWDTAECTSSFVFVCSRPALAPPVCADLLPNCADLLTADSNACVDNPDFASHSCPLTCSDQGDCADACTSLSCQNGGTCQVTNGTPHCVCPHGFEGDLCETAPECQDLEPICQTYVDDGDCSNGNMHWVLYACRLSCNWCDGGASQCQDIDPNCPSLVASTNCTTDHTLSNCRESCGTCDGLSCFDDLPNCRDRKAQGLCETDYEENVRLCPHTCDLCANPLCLDMNSDCDWWGSIGECENNPGYMTGNCPYTCDTCLVINACYSAPCLNGGTCTGDETGYTCQCTAQYQGDNCETETPPPPPSQDISGDPCAINSHACENGGTCMADGDDPRGYTCTCAQGYEGDDCSAALACDSDWTAGDDGQFCYKFVSTTITYAQADAHCQGIGATVTTTKTTAERNTVKNLAGTKIWLGATKNSNGEFEWNDLSLVSESENIYWKTGEPDGQIGSTTENVDCMHMNKAGKWVDTTCTKKRAFVCKKSLQ